MGMNDHYEKHVFRCNLFDKLGKPVLPVCIRTYSFRPEHSRFYEFLELRQSIFCVFVRFESKF